MISILPFQMVRTPLVSDHLLFPIPRPVNRRQSATGLAATNEALCSPLTLRLQTTPRRRSRPAWSAATCSRGCPSRCAGRRRLHDNAGKWAQDGARRRVAYEGFTGCDQGLFADAFCGSLGKLAPRVEIERCDPERVAESAPGSDFRLVLIDATPFPGTPPIWCAVAEKTCSFSCGCARQRAG